MADLAGNAWKYDKHCASEIPPSKWFSSSLTIIGSGCERERGPPGYRVLAYKVSNVVANNILITIIH